ncbi:hypothetical protein BD413DRAFT_209455 [Trametes elegans]|nr:hypothetical protein BD413DRAFT_209455 [Trametes elegans]
MGKRSLLALWTSATTASVVWYSSEGPEPSVSAQTIGRLCGCGLAGFDQDKSPPHRYYTQAKVHRSPCWAPYSVPINADRPVSYSIDLTSATATSSSPTIAPNNMRHSRRIAKLPATPAGVNPWDLEFLYHHE